MFFCVSGSFISKLKISTSLRASYAEPWPFLRARLHMIETVTIINFWWVSSKKVFLWRINFYRFIYSSELRLDAAINLLYVTDILS